MSVVRAGAAEVVLAAVRTAVHLANHVHRAQVRHQVALLFVDAAAESADKLKVNKQEDRAVRDRYGTTHCACTDIDFYEKHDRMQLHVLCGAPLSDITREHYEIAPN